jgi:hypothetical protein
MYSIIAQRTRPGRTQPLTFIRFEILGVEEDASDTFFCSHAPCRRKTDRHDLCTKNFHVTQRETGHDEDDGDKKEGKQCFK